MKIELGDCGFEFGWWFREFDTWPLKRQNDCDVEEIYKTRDREAGDLLGLQKNKQKREIYKSEMHGKTGYVVITKSGGSIY